ncbi:MAG: hypothetical protein Q9192_006431 [Flavoplaca navasiana]
MPNPLDNHPQETPAEMQLATGLIELNIMDNSDTPPNNPIIPISAEPIPKESNISATAASSISNIVTNLLRAICSLPDPATLQDHSCHICLNTFSHLRRASHPTPLRPHLRHLMPRGMDAREAIHQLSHVQDPRFGSSKKP